jgi:hypothetical protein
MRKILFLTTIITLLCSTISINAQTRYSPNGNAFTPQGDLKVLLICVRFGDSVNTAMPIDNNVWHKDSAYPKEIIEEKVFYTNYNTFATPINHNRDINNISRWYYEMSDSTFRLIVDTVSVKIFFTELL